MLSSKFTPASISFRRAGPPEGDNSSPKPTYKNSLYTCIKSTLQGKAVISPSGGGEPRRHFTLVL